MNITHYLKKSISGTVATCLTAGLLIPGVSVLADQASDVSLDVFTDPVLRETLSGVDFDTDQDGILSGDEIAAIKDLAIHDGGINTTEGLENLTSLERLNLCGSNITEIDLSSFPNLNTLEIFDNPLTSLDLSGLSEMFYLDVHNTDITSLDVSDCPKIADAVAYGTYCEGPYTDSYCYGGSEGCVIFDQGVVFTTGIYQGTDETGTEETEDVLDLSVPIDADHFPDYSLREYIGNNYDYNGDGVLSADEIGSVTSIVLQFENISTVKGIEYFYNLKELNLYGNNLTEIDVSSNIQLEDLEVSENHLGEIDISNNPNLTHLSVSENNLQELNISNCPNLVCLYISDNDIESLDVSNVPLLRDIFYYGYYERGAYRLDDPVGCFSETGGSYSFGCDSDLKLYFDGELISVLDIPIDEDHFPDPVFRDYVLDAYDDDDDDCLSWSETKDVNSIDIENKDISDMTGIEYFTRLKTLYASHCSLMSVNLENNRIIETVDISENPLNELDISSNRALASLNIENTDIQEIDVSNNPYLECTVQNGTFDYTCYPKGYSYYGQHNGNDFSGSFFIEPYVEIYSNGEMINEPVMLVRLEDYKFPDDSFRWYLDSNIDLDDDNYLSEEEINNTNGLDLSHNSSISNLTGIKYLTSITSLNCSYSILSSIDISNLTGLISLDIRGTDIEQLDISNNEKLICAFRNGTYENNSYDYFDNTTGETFSLSVDPDVELYVDGEMINEPVSYTPVCAIDDETFPDSNFRGFVTSRFDADEDGYLYEEEIAAITNLNLKEKNISSLTGIEYFTSLETLDCSNNTLTSLDLSDNTGLKVLKCSGNKIDSLDLSVNADLNYLDCSNNKLTSLVLPANPGLSYVDCNNNQLTNIDLSNNTELEELNCSDNQLESLDLSQNTELLRLSCSGEGIWQWDPGTNSAIHIPSGMSIGRLDLSNNTKLQCLFANYSGLTSLVFGSSDLTAVYCKYNSLETLDISMLENIQDFTCIGNMITELDITNNEILILAYENGIYSDCCYEYHDSEARKWYYFALDPTVKIYIDGEWVNEFEGLCTIDEESFPDETFRNYVLTNIDADEDQILSEEEAAEVTALYISEMGITTLKGIEYFTSLQYLYCADNSLTSLDVSANTELVELSCSGEGIWEEDSETNELVLIPSDMNIGSLDLTNNTKLERLYCTSAGVTDITIGEDNRLTSISCNDNLLTELDLSMCDAIENVECSGNEIADLDLGEGGSLTMLYCIGNPITELDLGSCSELTNLYCRENALTTLILPSSGKLEYLDCSWNMLDELDLDGQTGLLELKCSDNQITSIDASDSLELACMYVSDNQIKSIDISSNTALYSLDCNSNPLESLTIGNAPALNEIYCQNCGLTSIDVSGAPNLEWFKCSDNELTSLDISKNPDLCVLDCTGNNISTIDASNCHKLFGGVLWGVEPDVFEYREDASAGICGYWLENMSFQGFKFAYDIGTDVTCERWEKIDGKWYYYDMGTPVTGWKKIDNVWYYFDTSSGAMSTGWKKVSGKWYYFSGSGSMKTGWVLDGGEYYYFAGSGEMLTGWNKISKKWYYFAGSGEMLTGWQKIGDKFYYFEDSGAMVNGWKQISGKWYYLNDSGAMLTGWQKIADKWYYFEGSGSMVSGWKKISGKWYYFNGSGAMQTSKLTYKGKVYYFNSDGSCKNP